MKLMAGVDVSGRVAGGAAYSASEARGAPVPAVRHPAQRRRQAHQRQRLPERVSDTGPYKIS